MNNKNVRKNGSGYTDNVAGEAIEKVDAERERLGKLLTAIFAICDLSGFHIEERLVLRDKRTDKIWR